MRYLPTPLAKVEALKKQAKRLQRKASGKHTDCLDAVAKRHGYDHWHHVVRCANRETDVRHRWEALVYRCAQAVQAAIERKALLITSASAAGEAAVLLFSTADGDAWLLDARAQLAMCLCWQGHDHAVRIDARSGGIEIAWHGSFELRGPFFEVNTTLEHVGHRAIPGYPVDEIREFLNKVMSTERKIAQVILQEDVVPITPEIFAMLVAKGWDAERLQQDIADGAGYSPSRNSVLMPTMSDEDFEDLDDPEEPPSGSPT